MNFLTNLSLIKMKETNQLIKVWFQNARAKQRKVTQDGGKGDGINNSSSSDSFGTLEYKL
jgi:hypothetical protein